MTKTYSLLLRIIALGMVAGTAIMVCLSGSSDVKPAGDLIWKSDKPTFTKALRSEFPQCDSKVKDLRDKLMVDAQGNAKIMDFDTALKAKNVWVVASCN